MAAPLRVDDPNESLSPDLYQGRRLFEMAAFIALTAVLLSVATGFVSYARSRHAHLESLAVYNHVLADRLAHELDQHEPGLDPAKQTSALAAAWRQLPRYHPQMYVCAIGPDSRLVLHSRRPDRVGVHVGDNLVPFREDATVQHLIQARGDWVGENRSASGIRQLAAYSYSKNLGGLIVVHTPARVYERDVRSAALPWAIGYSAATLFLWPVCLLLAHLAFRRAYGVSVDAQQKWQQGFAELEHLYRTTPVGLCLLDTELRFQRINAQLADFHGYSIQRHLGRPVRELIPEIAERVEAICRQVIATGQPVLQLDFERPCPNGGPVRYYIGSCWPLQDGAGNVIGVSVVVQDVTSAREAEIARSQQQRELAHMGRLSTMGELVAGISHEINQPLTAISNLASASRRALNSSGVESELPVDDWLDDIVSQAHRCGEIIRRMKTYAGKGDVETKNLDLAPIVQDAISLIEYDARTKGIQVQLQFPSDAVMVRANEVQLQQVLVNLLRNAFDAADPESPQVRLSVEVAEREIRLAVADNGPGVEEADRQRIFDAFYTTKSDGLGLGLAISKTILQAMHGDLEYDADYTQGARFFVRLPTPLSSENGATDKATPDFLPQSPVDTDNVVNDTTTNSR